MTLPQNNNRSVTSLVHAHAGRAAVVMCGALSLPDELARAELPADAVYISAKEHGVMARGSADYVVAVDDAEREQRSFANGAPIVSGHPWADYVMHISVPESNSGRMAAWFAWVIGCNPIVIVGADCYQAGSYWHDRNAQTTGRLYTVEHQLQRWARLKELCPGAKFRVTRGPLLRVFNLYLPQERIVSPLHPREKVRAACAGEVVELLQRHREFVPGLVELHRNEAANLVREHVAKPVRAASLSLT
jgi:hypothetical protein